MMRSNRVALFLSAFILMALSNTQVFGQSCPTGYTPTQSKNYAESVYWKKDAKDYKDMLGAPDNDFAKLEKKGKGEIMVDLGVAIKNGDQITVNFASFKAGKSTTAEVYLWTNSSTYFKLGSRSTSKDYKTGSDQWVLTADRDAQYVSVFYSTGSEKVMVDAVAVSKTTCFPLISVNKTISVCKNFTLTYCLDTLLANLGIDNSYTATVKDKNVNTTNGSAKLIGSSTGNSGADCCDQGKPDKLTFRYVNSNVINNNQTALSGKSSVTTYSNPSGQTVKIVANDKSSPNDLSSPYFTKTVNVGESFTLDKNGGKWSSNMYLHIMNSAGTTALQLVQFHTSCSAPIVPGDQFGVLVLLGSEIAGAECGDITTGNCTSTLTYTPNTNFKGNDVVPFDICISKNGVTSCQSVNINVKVKDGNCSNGDCPIGFVPNQVDIHGDALFYKKDAKDYKNITGAPDNKFVKLEKAGAGEIGVKFTENIKNGDKITAYIASYKGGKSTKAEVWLWTGSNTYFKLGSRNTSKDYKTGSDKWEIIADRDAIAVSVYWESGSEKLMVDAISKTGSQTNCVAGNAITGTVWHDVDGDQVIDGNETERAGNVTVNLYQDTDHDGSIGSNEQTIIATMETDSDGFYAFTRPYPGSKDSYVVKIDENDLPTLSNMTTNNKEVASFTSAGNIDPNNDFGYHFLGDIKGKVSIDVNAGVVSADVPFGGVELKLFHDVNLNGVCDAVELKASTFTNANGTYTFSNLTNGNYIIKQIQPNGFTTLRDGDETDDGDANDLTFNQDDKITVTLGYNESDADNNFIEEGRDYGDLPSSFGVGVTSAFNTFNPNIKIGTNWDSETSANASNSANGDDIDNIDDEDGVTFPSEMKGGETVNILVDVYNNSAANAYLNIFVDADNDQVFDVDECVQVVVNNASNVQTISVPFIMPNDAITGQVFTRVRLSTNAEKSATGSHVGGEIEDYQSSIVALPVDLLAFNGEIEGQNVALNWTTATELNNEGFELQRRYVGDPKFESVAFIDGAGNSTGVLNYKFVDTDVSWQKQTVYYRLKQIDFDGYFEFSDQIAFSKKANVKIVIYPNPARDWIKLALIGEDMQIIDNIAVTDQFGKEVTDLVEITNTGRSCFISAQGLRSGVYFLKTNVGGDIIIKRFSLHR